MKRLEVPFEVLSDEHFALTQGAAAADLHRRRHDADEAADPDRRATDTIEHVFYPVFPPDKHAEEVIAWLKRIQLGAGR